MAKQSYSIKGTNISNGDSVGNHIEQTVSVDDNILPAPQELAKYKSIDPKIVDFLIKSSEREQLHRHNQDEKKLNMVCRNLRFGRYCKYSICIHKQKSVIPTISLFLF